MQNFFQVLFTQTAWSLKHWFRVSTKCYRLPVPQKPPEQGMLAVQTVGHPDSLYFVSDVKEGKDDSNWSFLPKKRSIHNDQTQKGQNHHNAWESFLLQCSHIDRLRKKMSYWSAVCKQSHHPSINRRKSAPAVGAQREEKLAGIVKVTHSVWLCRRS